MRLRTLLETEGVGYRGTCHRAAFTAQALANLEGINPRHVAKPVIVKDDLGYCMCVVPGDAHVDLGKVADLLGVVHVELAAEHELRYLCPECELGAEPPIGALFGMKTIVDQTLHDDQTLIMQAGTHTDAIRIRREDWEQLCSPIVGDIRRADRGRC